MWNISKRPSWYLKSVLARWLATWAFQLTGWYAQFTMQCFCEVASSSLGQDCTGWHLLCIQYTCITLEQQQFILQRELADWWLLHGHCMTFFPSVNKSGKLLYSTTLSITCQNTVMKSVEAICLFENDVHQIEKQSLTIPILYGKWRRTFCFALYFCL